MLPSQTLIPCVLTDGEEIADQRELILEDLIEYQQQVSVTTGDNWVWVESCILPIGANNWLVVDAGGNQINCIDVFFDGTRIFTALSSKMSDRNSGTDLTQLLQF